MTTPTPTESDKRAAKRIIGIYAEYDLEGVTQTERIIAEEMAAEREALSKAKKSIEGLTRLVEELKFAHPHISIGNSVTIGRGSSSRLIAMMPSKSTLPKRFLG